MMSIILKGIDLPKCSNEDCIVVIRHDKAEVWQKVVLTGYKEQTVEAIQIPKGHGRIIDESEASENVACFHGTAWLDTDGIEPLLEAEEKR